MYGSDTICAGATICLIASLIWTVQGASDCTSGTPVSKDDLTAFRVSLSSPIALRTEVTYAQAAELVPDGLSEGNAPFFQMPVPQYIVTPENEQDVVKAIQFAADHGLKTSARGTGHQISGIAVPSCGIVIDMSNLNKISLAPDLQSATVQMGARSGALFNETLPRGVMPVAGHCQHVGVAGFTLGGGYGWGSRYFGAATDNVLSMDIVTVGPNRTATLARLDYKSDPELFFGMRGAGGMLGVAVSMTVKTHPIPQTTTNATYAFNISRAQEVVTWWEAWFKASPRTLESGIIIKRDHSLGPYITIWVVLVNASSPETDTAFANLSAFASNRSIPALDGGLSTNTSTLAMLTDYPTYCGNLSQATYWNTYYTKNSTIPQGLVSTMVTWITNTTSDGAYFVMYADLPPASGPAANAYGFRGTYQTEVIDAWDRSAGGAVVDGDANHIAWVKAASAAVIPFTSGRYVNQLMFDFPDDNRASYEPATWERIVKLKAAHDPLNLFRDLNFARPGASTASSK
uniref:Putative extracellular protein CSOL_035 n=1 Tax=Pseudococcomyxa simplex TaxID=464287 RepID=A0A7L9QED1_9CHLO|nr:putative extracellular protein CSOL_035 [Pseudococcomyxa simplex]